MTVEPGTVSGRIGTSRVRGLDAIRFICAVWVVISHMGALPYVVDISRSTTPGLMLSSLGNNLMDGPAAVIVFFVISGFCIHFPYRNVRSIELFPYFARRHIRILIPVAAAMVLGSFVGAREAIFQNSVLWSLVCEEVYYTIYPVLLWARARWSWPSLIVVAFAAAYAVVLSNPGEGGIYPGFGPALNWVVGLPCWLLGCQLAEQWDAVSQEHPVSTTRLWMWRATLFGTSVVLTELRYHSPLTYPWTLDLFALLVVFWLRLEIVTWIRNKPPRALELGGRFSYSIYLVHLQALALLARFGHGAGVWMGVNWVGRLLFVLAFSFLFYAIVELPSHRLARFVYGLVTTGRARTAQALDRPLRSPATAPSP